MGVLRGLNRDSSLPLLRRRRLGQWVLAILLIESVVVTANGMRCPLTNLAARYATEQPANFDIYLPLWLAKYNVPIFGSWFAADLLFALAIWRTRLFTN